MRQAASGCYPPASRLWGRHPGCLNGPVGCLVFSFTMQSRTPRLGWIAQVLADPDVPPAPAEPVPFARQPLRLVSGGTRAPGRGGGKAPRLVSHDPDRRFGAPSDERPKAGR